VPTGRMSSYDLTVGIKLDIEDLIWLISPHDVPLLGGSGADGASALSKGDCFEKKVEWLDEELLLPKSTVAALATTTEAVVTVASGHQLRFSTGDVVRTQLNERVRVTGYGTTADTLLVTRGFDSSSSTTLSTNDTLLITGKALAEGTDPENARALDRNARFNMTQIFGPTAVHVTGSEQEVAKYGLRGGEDEFDHQVANRTKEQWIEVEHAILYGTRVEDVTNEWRQMGGFINYITTNIDSATTVLTESTYLDQLQASYDAGGMIDRSVQGSKQKRTISGFSTNLTINTTRLDDSRGTVVQYFDSDFGRVTMILDRHTRTRDLFLFGRDQAEVVTLRPMQFEMLAKTGDSDKGQVLCEKSMRFRKESHSARFSALT
jgi:hypothetical protein